jgi:peptide deformylase
VAILHVAQIGHPILRRVCDPVDPAMIPTEPFQRFLDDLLDTMFEYDGAGLAAPQVHQSIQVVCLTLDDDRGPEFLINPVITPLTEELDRTYEGCLSIDAMRAAVERPNRVRVEALDRTGAPLDYELEDFAAVVVQHECDHLQGILFVDRCDTKTLAFLKEYRRFGPIDEWDLQAGTHSADEEETDFMERQELEEALRTEELTLDEDTAEARY